jgi:hypothetical protein
MVKNRPSIPVNAGRRSSRVRYFLDFLNTVTIDGGHYGQRDSKGKAIGSIRNGEAYYGEADILGKTYITGYEPIRDNKGDVIGIYYVGYLKGQ